MAKVINCPDGVTVQGETDEDLLTNARQHIAEAHPEMVG